MTPPFGVGLLIYSFVLLSNWLLQFPDLFIARGVPFGVTIKLLVYLVPAILAFTVPMSVIMGILAGLGRLSSDSETVAFKSLGVSHGRMLRPLAVFGLAGWLATSILTLYAAPAANFKWQQTVAASVLDKFQLEIAPREFNESVANKVIYMQDAREKDWDKVFLAFLGGPQESKVVLARKGKLNFYPRSKRATIELFDAVQHTLALDEPEIYQVAALAHVEEEIEIANLLGGFTAEKRAREQNIEELAASLAEIRRREAGLSAEKAEAEARGLPDGHPDRRRPALALEQAGREHRTVLVEIHKRFALPVVCWVFVFLGLPLGLSTKKGGRASGFTLSIVIILAYYIFITAGEKTALDGRVPPWLGMWGGNFVFGLLSVFLYVRSARERPFLALSGRRLPALEKSRPEGGRPKRADRRAFPNLPFPGILDRYVIRRYLLIAVLIVLSVLAVSAIVTFFDRLGNVYENRKPLSLLFDYIRHRLPEFFHLGLPVAALMATLLTLGLFTKFNEITAMKACGISLYRAIVPLLVLAGLAALLSFELQENALPRNNRKAAEIWDRIMDRPPRHFGAAGRRWVANAGRDRFYHFSAFDPAALNFARLWVEEIDPARWTFRRRIFAERGRLEGEALRLEDGWVRVLEEDGMRAVSFEKFAALEVPVEEGRSLFLKESKEPAEMTFGELKAHIGEVRALGYDTTRFRVDLASKISFPFAALIMTLVGIPFAFSMGKRGTLVGVGVGLGIAILYWVAIGVFRSLGYAGMLTVFLAAWGPNLIFGLLGLYLLFRLRT
ncbi:MAG: YjgP/YjgQ family permease [Candidatus Aminicenantes bacterium]|nr:YjgP/YjgQ family permease [Candidatus Aminicenantes bacterium]